VSGLTIGQALPLRPWARAFFDFSPAGTDRVGGRDVVVVAYEQAAPNPRFGFDLALPSELRRATPLYRGRLWLDAATGRLWREVREVTVRPAGSAAPVVVQRTEFEYEASRFEILVPKHIVFSALLRFAKTDAGVTSSLDYRVTFAYGPFRRFTTTSDNGEIARVAPGQPGEPAAAPPAPAPDADLGPEFGPDAPLGPPEPSAAPPVSRPEPTVARAVPAPARPAPPSPRPTAVSALPPGRADASLPSSVPPPAPPVVSISAPPPPTPPGAKFRVPPS